MNDRIASAARHAAWRLQTLGYDGLNFLIRLIPLDWASALGGTVVGFLGPLTSRNQIVLRNMELAFPEMSPAARGELAREHWRVLGRTFLEFPLVDRIARPGAGRLEVLGLERLKEIAGRGEAVVLVSGHISNWEVMMAAIVGSGLKSRVSYRPANNPYMDARIHQNRRRYGVELFAAKGDDGTRDLLSAFNNGETVAMLYDQRDDRGVEAPFFGHMVMTAAGPARFALRSDCRLVPMSVVRLKGARFRVTVHQPIELERTGDRGRDLAAAVARINAFIEARIREHPADWMWAHRRWPAACYEGLRAPQAPGSARGGLDLFARAAAGPGVGRIVSAATAGTEVVAGPHERAGMEDHRMQPVEHRPRRHRLDHELGDARVARLEHARLLGVAGQHDDGQEGIGAVGGLADQAGEFNPVHRRHLEIDDGDVGGPLAQGGQGFGAVPAFANLLDPDAGQHGGHDRAHVLVVVNQQHPHRAKRRCHP